MAQMLFCDDVFPDFLRIDNRFCTVIVLKFVMSVGDHGSLNGRSALTVVLLSRRSLSRFAKTGPVERSATIPSYALADNHTYKHVTIVDRKMEHNFAAKKLRVDVSYQNSTIT